MKNSLFYTLTLTVGLLGASLAPTTAVQTQPAQREMNDLTYKLKGLETDLDLAARKRDRAREQYKAGLVNQDEVDSAQSAVNKLTLSIQQVQRDRANVAARAAFSKPVSIQLDHASVQQFASALSKATGIPVKVDSSVPEAASTALTVDVQDVPFSSVLEAIADKTDLMIAPDGTGVIFKKWPHLNDRIYRSAIAPWSSEWGVPPTVGDTLALRGAGYVSRVGQFFGGSGSGGFGSGNSGASGAGGIGGSSGFGGGQDGGVGGGQQLGTGVFGGVVPGDQPGNGGARGITEASRAMPFTMTNAADHVIVIAEPGVNEGGLSGVWMTAYLVDNGGFHRLAVGFHPSANRPRTTSNSRSSNPFQRSPGGSNSTRDEGGQKSSFPGAGGGGLNSGAGFPGGGGGALESGSSTGRGGGRAK